MAHMMWTSSLFVFTCTWPMKIMVIRVSTCPIGKSTVLHVKDLSQMNLDSLPSPKCRTERHEGQDIILHIPTPPSSSSHQTRNCCLYIYSEPEHNNETRHQYLPTSSWAENYRKDKSAEYVATNFVVKEFRRKRCAVEICSLSPACRGFCQWPVLFGQRDLLGLHWCRSEMESQIRA